MLTKEEAQAYVARWKAVQAVEREESRRSTPQQRWKQFITILELVEGLGLQIPDTAEEDMQVILRWKRIKEHYERLDQP